MNRMPQTPEEWRDYEADRIMAKVTASREKIEKTHSLKKLVEMQVAAIRKERDDKRDRATCNPSN